MAAHYDHHIVVKLLLADKRVDPSARDNYAIRYAASNGHITVVRLLLGDDRIDPSAKDNWAINLAAKYGHLEVVKLLKEYEEKKIQVQKIHIQINCPKELKGSISFDDIKITYK